MDDTVTQTLDRDRKCRREDLVNLYNLLLHRDPESNDAIDPRVGRPIAKIFADFLRSEEFALRVVKMSTAERSAEADYRGSGRLVDLADWAVRTLPLGPETGNRLIEASDWEEADIALMRDSTVIDLVPGLQEPRNRRAIERCYFGREGGVTIDAVFVSPEGRCFVSGWIDTAHPVPIRELAVYRGAEQLGMTTSVARCRRSEMAARFPEAAPGLAGFWAIVALDRPVAAGTKLEVSLAADKGRSCLADGAVGVGEARLRDIALEHLAHAQYHGDPTAEAFFQLDNGVGRSLIDLNSGIVARIVEGGYQMRFGARRPFYDGSIIVCLYGKPEFLTLQAALFSQCPGYDRYEFIYVSNSPELGETLVNDAGIASRIYGVAITLIILPGNAGFGAANNVAAAAAETDRLLLINPDVLPRDPEWPRRHAEMVRDQPADQVRLFGASLYYDDGSLMHGGMYINVGGGFSPRDGRMIRRDVLQVEHYGKGAPPETEAYRASRPVPAVTGAFMSIDRAWFERLGGFSRDYIFGHYEDVDLCLRSLKAGTPVWVHDLPFWHLESKGSTHAAVHLGGRLVNIWLLTSTWGEHVKNGLNGRDPAHFAAPRQPKLPGPTSTVPPARQRRRGAR
jgi:GT2 family glycosyltransferase